MTEEDFLAAIAATPEDPVRLVYADWLEQRGDPRAELVRIEAQLWAAPIDLVRYRGLQRRRTELRVGCDLAWQLAIERPSMAEIRRRVELLSELDPKREIFASSRHQYALPDPMPEADVAALEAKHGFTVPAQYRTYLTQLANGGAGPDYGIWPFSAGPELAAAFPAPASEKAMEAAGEELESPQGAIVVAEVGCGAFFWLAISGPAAGTVWLQTEYSTWFPLLADGRVAYSETVPKLHFLDWLVRWLDSTLSQLARRTPDDDHVFERPPEQVTDCNLSGRKLAAVPDGLRKLVHVQRLDLSNNPLAELPAWIGELRALDHLNLGATTLRSLPDAITELPLRRLSCFQAKSLERIPDAIGRIATLEELDLRWCAITELPDSFGDLANLRKLEINSNKLARVPASLGKLRQLEKLELFSNQLTTLPDELAALDRVTEVTLQANRFVTLPSCLAAMPIRRINLGQNPLDLAAAFRFLATIPTLRQLAIASSGLTSIPDELGLLVQLESLDLSYNRLASLPASIGNLTQLRTLSVTSNANPSLHADAMRLVTLVAP
jgi:uncharacterized protein (TIGR02996 family)